MTRDDRTRPERPIGVTIIAVLAAVAGVFGTLGTLGMMAFLSAAGGAAGGLLMAIAITTLIVSVVSLVFAYGAWTLQPWAWTLGVVLESVAAVLGLYSLADGDVSSLVTIGIAAVVLWYLFQPSVKAAFGRA